jgi:non-ribosomal peptide synthetase component F
MTTIHELFAEQVRHAPTATALRFRGEDLTYGQLDARAEHLARRLRAAGVGPESVVGVCLERSFEMIVALVAVLKAGGAYLPLHPDEPAVRLRYMLDHAEARVLLTERVSVPGVTTFTVDSAESTDAVPLTGSADALAY